MANDGLSELRRQLGGDVPACVRQLADCDLDDLASAIADARRRDGEALAAAGERALSHVPRLLRAPIRRVAG